ncbi:MAG: folylpolyglutamate synthase/dihydrofolate synthase family protein [Bacteroidaceae bacterium]
MTYQETISYLYQTVPVFERIGKDGYKEGLTNTLILDEHFSHPHLSFPTIHIAGTNGKGSCAHTIAAILQLAGKRVGLYTSPHLKDFRERIRVNGIPISEQYVIDFVENERHFFEALGPSFFELTTALAFKYFKESNVDIAVIEVGLGGRLDCTNIIHPILSIITNISFDHMQFLGHTLQKIAQEKAGIIKNGVPIIIGETIPETKPVFLEKAIQEQAPIFFAEEQQQIKSSLPNYEKGSRDFVTKDFELLHGELGGLCQEKNANTILNAVIELRKQGFSISNQNVKDGFAHVCETTGLMGRWQKVQNCPTVVCDTGHNEGGFTYISRQLQAQKCKTLRIVFGMVSDKDICAVLKLLPNNARYYFTKAEIKRALDENELKKMAENYGLQGNSFATVGLAYQAALKDSSPEDFIYIGGSSYIVADFLNLF